MDNGETATAVPRRSKRMIVLVVVAVAGLIGLGFTRFGPTAEAQAPAETPSTYAAAAPATAAPAEPSELDRAVTELQDFVSRTRGLPFKAPVKATILDDDAFNAKLMDSGVIDRAEIEKQAGILRALGLLDTSEDLEAAVSGVPSGVLGFYHYVNKELVVRGTEVNAAVKRVLVHELTHALDDQHFTLYRPALLGDNEGLDAFRSLAEGSAERVEHAYLDSLSTDDRAAAEAAPVLVEDALQRVPRVVQLAVAFPYVMGSRFVDGLWAYKGQAALDDAFRNPPTTTEHILVPQTYLAGHGAAAINDPPADGPVIDKGTLGQLGLLLLLSGNLTDGTLAPAAAGWEGDRYVAWKDGARTCVRARFHMGSPWEAELLALALEVWASDGRSAVVEAPGTVFVTSCA